VAKNDYRVGRRQVSFVVDEGLWGAVRDAARVRGCSMSDVVRDALLSEVVVEAPMLRGQPDWESIMAAGRAAKVVYPVDVRVVDPLEEIA
jgi:hypothetical protein